jgi:hypothetical protein
MPLLDLSAAMAAFKAALFVAIASAKSKNFPSYCPIFRSPIYSVVLTRYAIYSLRPYTPPVRQTPTGPCRRMSLSWVISRGCKPASPDAITAAIACGLTWVVSFRVLTKDNGTRNRQFS